MRVWIECSLGLAELTGPLGLGLLSWSFVSGMPFSTRGQGTKMGR